MSLKVTVVTVCFNAAKTIERTVQSVLAQDYPYLEYIIVDGHSNDGTLQILKLWTNRFRLISEKDKGLYDAMNKGWRAASGDLIHFLNADDWYVGPHVISEFIRSIELNLSIPNDRKREAIWYGKLIYHEVTGENFIMGHEVRPGEMKYQVEGIHQPASFFPRLGFIKVGGFDLNYRIAADYDLTRRMYNSVPSAFIDIEVSHMSGGGLSSTQALAGIRENISVAATHGESILLTYLFYFKPFLKLTLRSRAPKIYGLLKKIYRNLHTKFFLS